MAASGIALRAMRTEFYKAATEKYNTSNEEIIRVLINAGFEVFKMEETPQYNAILDKFFNEGKKQQKTVTEAITPGPSSIRYTEVKSPCPISGCSGHKIWNMGNSIDWSCSVGGRRHYWALRGAELYLGPTAAYEDLCKKALEIFRGMERLNAEKEKEKAAV